MTENDLTPDYIAERVERLQGESAFAILSKANELEAKGMNVIHLEIGQPDFKTPENIIDAAKEAMSDGYTGYGPTLGYNELREAVADYVKEYKNIDATKDNVVIVPGGKPTMFFTMLTLVEPGDEVIYPNPGFPIYESCIKFARGIPVPMPLTADNDFRPDVEKLKSLITPKTKLIIINNPGNPTGGIFEKEDILAIADILKDRPDIFVLSDEIYDRLMYDGETISIASIPEIRDRTLVLDGFSKTYAMTGWRIGYTASSKQIAKLMASMQSHMTSNPNSIAQMAALAAIEGPQDCVENMREKFEERRDYIYDRVAKMPYLKTLKPEGAFYLFVDFSGTYGKKYNNTVLESAAQIGALLLDEELIAVVPCADFGMPDYIRFSYATSNENIKKGMDRLEDFISKLK